MPQYFHWKKKNQVLTAYVEISAEYGLLSFSCSLWKKSEKDKHWNRKIENSHARENHMRRKAIIHFQRPYDKNLKLDDVFLKKYLHKYISKNGCQGEIQDYTLTNHLFKTIQECWRSRGHVYKNCDPTYFDLFYSYVYKWVKTPHH